MDADQLDTPTHIQETCDPTVGQVETSLPGTPSLTDGSSYSSTSSSRMLLSQGHSPGASSTDSNGSKACSNHSEMP